MGKPSSKIFPVDTRNKTSFLTSTTAVDTQHMSRTQSRLVVKPKLTLSLSAYKNTLINLLNLSIHLILEFLDLKGLAHFWAYPPNNFASQYNTKVVAIFFLSIAKILLIFYFRYFGHAYPFPSKTIMPNCRNFDIFLHAKNELHS